jgi:hypothetical protein
MGHLQRAHDLATPTRFEEPFGWSANAEGGVRAKGDVSLDAILAEGIA